MGATSLRAMVDDALAVDPDGDEWLPRVRRLRELDDRESFDAIVALTASENPAERALAAAVLGQFGVKTFLPGEPWVVRPRPWAAPAVDVLLDLLAREREDDVVMSIAYALGHLDDPRAIEPLTQIRHHPNEDVRHGIVCGLLGHDDDRAVDALIELSRDEDSDVRDWATFGLGGQIGRDTPQLRDALAVRLDDPDEVTRDEAIAGLGQRGDARAIEPLLERISDGWEGMLIDEALYGLDRSVADPRIAAAAAERTAEDPTWRDRAKPSWEAPR